MPISGKWKWGIPFGHWVPLRIVSPVCDDINNSTSVHNFNHNVSVLANSNKWGLSNNVVAAVQSQGTVIIGGLGDRCMMDSGSLILLGTESFVEKCSQCQSPQALSWYQQQGNLYELLDKLLHVIVLVTYKLITVLLLFTLIIPVILGLDFLHKPTAKDHHLDHTGGCTDGMQPILSEIWEHQLNH